MRTRGRLLLLPSFAVAMTGWMLSLGCGSSKSSSGLSCGSGTEQRGNECVVVADAMAADASNGDGGTTSTLPEFAGVTGVAPASTTSLFVVWSPGKVPANPAAPLRYPGSAGPASKPRAYGSPAATTGAGATSAEIGELTTGTEYSVAVRAVNSAGLEDTNTVVLKGTPAADMTAPTFAGLVSASPGGSGAVALSWAPATDDTTPSQAITYLVFESDTSSANETGPAEDFTSPVLVTPPGATTATVRRLVDATKTRYFIVRARDASGNVDSNVIEKSSVPGPDVVPPAFEGCAAATNVQALTIAASWSAATDDVSDPPDITYDIYKSTVSGTYDFTTPFAVVTGQTEAVMPELQPLTQYFFVCRAKDQAGNEDQNTVEVTATTGKNPVPPTFGGITGIVPDPVNRTAMLTWAAATDNSGSGAPLVYDVYIATTAGGENYNRPPFVTSPGGATGMTVTNLPSNATIYLVVRARDGDGNHDVSSPPVEKSMMTDVSFALDIQTLFADDCGVVGCHVPGSPTGGLILAPGFAYKNIVGVAALEAGSFTLDGGTVNYVTPFDPNESYLNMKVNPTLYASYKAQTPPKVIGSQMPAQSTGSILTPPELSAIALWISQGALNN